MSEYRENRFGSAPLVPVGDIPTSPQVFKSLFDANTILKADTDNLPTALEIAEQRLVGRKLGGVIDALAKADILEIINVEDGATKYPDTGEQAFLDADHTKLDAIEALADVTNAVNVGSSIHGVAAKATPVNADTIPLIDSAAANVLKKVTWANIKATLKTYFDTLYDVLGGLATHIADTSTHGVAGAIADVADIAIDANLSVAAQAAVTASHTQDTDTDLGALGTKDPAIDADKLIYRDSTAADVLVTSTWTQIKAFLKTYFDGLYRGATADHTHASTGAQGGPLTLPQVNEPVAMTTTATELNLVDDDIFWYLAYARPGLAIVPLHNWYNVRTGTGNVSQNGPTRLASYLGATTLSSCLQAFWPTMMGLVQQVDFDESFRTVWKAYTLRHNIDPTNMTSRLGYRGQVLPSMTTLAHKGVEIYVTGASRRLWLCTHNGATLTTLDTAWDLTNDTPYNIEFVFTPATSFEVFFDGVSKGEITANLPTGGGTQIMGWFGSIRDGGADTTLYMGSTMGIPGLYTDYRP